MGYLLWTHLPSDAQMVTHAPDDISWRTISEAWDQPAAFPYLERDWVGPALWIHKTGRELRQVGLHCDQMIMR